MTLQAIDWQWFFLWVGSAACVAGICWFFIYKFRIEAYEIDTNRRLKLEVEARREELRLREERLRRDFEIWDSWRAIYISLIDSFDRRMSDRESKAAVVDNDELWRESYPAKIEMRRAISRLGLVPVPTSLDSPARSVSPRARKRHSQWLTLSEPRALNEYHTAPWEYLHRPTCTRLMIFRSCRHNYRAWVFRAFIIDPTQDSSALEDHECADYSQAIEIREYRLFDVLDEEDFPQAKLQAQRWLMKQLTGRWQQHDSPLNYPFRDWNEWAE